ncbi:MAG TPA: hypothetical protein PK089_06040 [Methanoregulaceae archaeon]|nr:hypothetical protein [Methanoregulaceae archaeon]HQJ87862.1 hypothetical protein [Methanoregulaceae archaeon]
MLRALPAGALLLVLLFAAALSGGCVALYTVSEAIDPPPQMPGGDPRAGLPLFPPGIPVPTPVPAPDGTAPQVVTRGPTAPPSEPPPGTTVPAGPLTVPSSGTPADPATQSSTAPTTPTPPGSNRTLSITDGLPGWDEAPVPSSTPIDELPGGGGVYHPIVTPLPPV